MAIEHPPSLEYTLVGNELTIHFDTIRVEQQGEKVVCLFSFGGKHLFTLAQTGRIEDGVTISQFEGHMKGKFL